MHVLHNVYSRVERLSSSPTINQYQYFCCINLIEFCAQNKTSILALFKNLFKIIFIFWDRYMLCLACRSQRQLFIPRGFPRNQNIVTPLWQLTCHLIAPKFDSVISEVHSYYI